MNIALPGRRPLAVLLAFILLAAGIVFFAPAQSAQAAGLNSSYASSFLSVINQKRVSAGRLALKTNEYITKFNNEFLTKVAKNQTGAPATALPPGYAEPLSEAGGYVFGGKDTSSRFSYAKANFPSDTDFQAIINNSALDYGSVAVYATSTRVYVSLIAFDYPSALFTKTSTPAISGSVKVGATLTAKPGTYSPAADSYAYQWKSNGVVVGSNASTYTPVPADKGKKITVSVTGSKSGYATSRVRTSSSKTVATGTVKLSGLTIAGKRNVNQTLSIDDLTVTPSVAATYLTPSIQWYRDGKKIAGQTSGSYVQIAADRGKKITVKIGVSGAGYKSTSITSKGVVTDYPLQTAKPTPTISGTTKYKDVLTATPGTWDVGTTLSYQWYAGGKAISKATKTTYAIASADIGKTITVKVTSRKTGFAVSSASSAATGVVTALPFTSAGTADITGDFVKGKTLTAKVTGTSPSASYSYQWYKSDTSTKLSGATKSTLKLTQTHINYGAVHVVIKVKKTGYTTVELTAMRGLN